MPLDVTISPLYRISGKEIATMPGLLALVPPRGAARGREQDRLLVYLLLTGTSVFTTSEYMKFAEDTAKIFYSTAGSLTSALRTATESLNKSLLDRNMETSSRGQYALGWLAIAALRDMQATFLLSGPMHAYHFSQNEARHIFEPSVSGKGLGMGQSTSIHYAQATLDMGDRLLFCGKVPNEWTTPLNDSKPSSLAAMRRRLVTSTTQDLNAVLMQTSNGPGSMNLLSGTAEPQEEKIEEVPAPPVLTSNLPRREEQISNPEVDSPPLSAHVVQPSAYAIPATEQNQNTNPLSNLPQNTSGPRNFPSSIPRSGTQNTQPLSQPSILDSVKTPPVIEEEKPEEPLPPREPSPSTRRAARTLAGGIQFSRKLGSSISERMRNFLPRLLPNSDSTSSASAPSNFAMFVISILIPLIVVVVFFVVYTKYGRSQLYDAFIQQARQQRDQAILLTNPIEQRTAWETVITSLARAEEHAVTNETTSLHKEANDNLDRLLGISSLQFNPVFSSNLGIEISRMAATESDLFMLNAENGEVLRAQLTSGRGFQLDTAFNCRPGDYGNYKVGPLVDILAMPTLNSINATMLGVDASGNLLYCAPGQVAQAIPLLPPDTNWGRITAFVLDGGNLYVLDAPARAVWVYNGKDGAFIDRPYFFFGEQTPSQDVIDLVVSGDELTMLHADGHLSNCSYSRVEAKPSKCEDPINMVNPFPAYRENELFGSAHFTQMLFAAPPDQSILLLDADRSTVMRFASRTLELQNQFRPMQGSGNPVPAEPVDAFAVSPNHILYLAVNGQVYFAQTP